MMMLLLLLRVLTNIRLAVRATSSGMRWHDAILQLATVQIEYVRNVKAGGALRGRYFRVEETIGEKKVMKKLAC